MNIVSQIFKSFGYDKAIETLSTEPLNLKIKDYGDYCVINYDQINSPKLDPIVIQSRSLMVNREGDIMSRAFPRFFNHGEVEDSEFDYESMIPLTKYDGSLIKIYFNNVENRWEIATRGTAHAEAETINGTTFREEVLKVIEKTEEEFQNEMETLPKLYTYVFEYCSPDNRIVTLYDESYLVLLSVVNNNSGEEHLVHHVRYSLETYHDFYDIFAHIFSNVKKCGVEINGPLDLDYINKVKDRTDDSEGVVCVDRHGNRIKVKSEFYVRLHHIRGELNLTDKRACVLIFEGEEEEFLSYFPEWTDKIQTHKNRLNNMLNAIEDEYGKIKGIESQKDYAEAVNGGNHNFGKILFSMRSNNKSAKEVFNNLLLSTKLKFLLDNS